MPLCATIAVPFLHRSPSTSIPPRSRCLASSAPVFRARAFDLILNLAMHSLILEPSSSGRPRDPATESNASAADTSLGTTPPASTLLGSEGLPGAHIRGGHRLSRVSGSRVAGGAPGGTATSASDLEGARPRAWAGGGSRQKPLTRAFNAWLRAALFESLSLLSQVSRGGDGGSGIRRGRR